MSIPMSAQCYVCHLRRNTEIARSLAGDEGADQVARGLMQAYLEAPDHAGSPWFGPRVTELLEQYCGVTGDRYAEEKAESNRYVLSRMEKIRAYIAGSDDPVYAGLQMAILGNYIDFSALHGEVSFEKLDEMLENARDIRVEKAAWEALLSDLAQAKTLLYLTDNAGEIGFDRIFAEELQKKYPQLAMTFCVRGGNAGNDATRADAAEVEIPFPVIDNGSTIAGTVPERLGAEAARAFETADVILSKGQANVETLWGCGKNIYYAFLIKCARFESTFGKAKFTPMLVRERDR